MVPLSPRRKAHEEDPMITPTILTVSAAVLPLLIPPTGNCVFGQMGDPGADEQAVAAFVDAVDDYVAVQRRLKRAGLSIARISDPEQAEAAAEELRVRLRDARPQAAHGGFFTPAVADVFRVRIRAAFRERARDVAAHLPVLPLELEYRLVGRDLVLRDVDANLVLDVLDLALPTPELIVPDDDEEFIEDDEFIGCLEETR
jgi:hypothetical protein